MDTVLIIISGSWLILGEMAPYLLFGFLVAGVLSVFVSPAWVERHLGGHGFVAAFKASLFGVPLPLCSCGVIPVAASLRRHGASRSATTAFVLSTPQTGVDSIAVTYALLGPVFAIFRPLAALLTGLIGGGLVDAFGRSNQDTDPDASQPAACSEPCCDTSAHRSRWVRALHYGLITLPRDIGAALLLGVLITGVIMVWVPVNYGESYIGGGIVSMLLMIVAGIPLYICATASVPFAVALLHMGGSPGAALAFLIAGPATNAAAFTTIWKVLGRRTAIHYIATVVVGAIVCGLTLDWLVGIVPAAVPKIATHGHDMPETAWITHFWAISLLVLLVVSSKPLARWGKSRRDARAESPATVAGERLELAVSGMTCSHCAQSVQRGLSECDGVESADIDLVAGTAVVTGEHLDREQLAAAVEGLGYRVEAPELA